MPVRVLRVALPLAVSVLLLTAAPALAACTISTTPVTFGAYDVFATAPLDSTGTVTFRCGQGDKNITITLSKGGAATFNPRQMRSGAQTLAYNLYRDATRTSIWGDGTGGTTIYSNANPPAKDDVSVTIYGRIPTGQDVTAGSYADTITATILF